MIDLLRLCRLYYALPMALTFLLTVCYAEGTAAAAFETDTLVATVALGLVIAAAYVFNDYRDVQVDRVNAPHRPLVRGTIRPTSAAISAALLLAAGMTMAVIASPPFAAVLAIVAGLLIVYDLTSKRLGRSSRSWSPC